MANTYVDYTGDGSNTDFVFSFPFLEDSHVVVEVDGVDKTIAGGDFTLPTTSLVRMTTAPSNLSAVRVKRVSGFDTDLVDFVNGSVLNEADLDKAYLHNRYLNEEAAEGNNASMQTVGGGTDFNAESKKIVNLATPTVGTDAANKNYIDDRVALASSNLNGFDKSTHTGDNTETAFTLSFTPQTNTAEAYIVTIDGVVQIPTTAYSVSTSTNKITFTSAPPTSANIVVVPIGTASSANDTTVLSTGSTTSRTLANRFADVVNVLDYIPSAQHSAIKSGTSTYDASTDIQTALNKRGKVIFPSGTYVINTWLKVLANTHIEGQEATIQVSSSVVSGDNFEGAFTLSNVLNGENCHDISINNINIDLNNAPAANGINVRDGSYNIRVDNVHIKNGSHDKTGYKGGRAIVVEAGADSLSNPDNVVITNFTIEDTYNAIGIAGNSDSPGKNIVISNGVVENCEILLGVFGNSAGFPHDIQEAGWLVSNIHAYNVGKSTTYTREHGVFNFSRGCNGIISNVRIANDTSYDDNVDSLFMGEAANIFADNIVYEGDLVRSVFRISTWTEDDALGATKYGSRRLKFTNINVLGTSPDTVFYGYTYNAALTETEGDANPFDNYFDLSINELSGDRLMTALAATYPKFFLKLHERSGFVNFEGYIQESGISNTLSNLDNKNVIAHDSSLIQGNLNVTNFETDSSKGITCSSFKPTIEFNDLSGGTPDKFRITSDNSILSIEIDPAGGASTSGYYEFIADRFTPSTAQDGALDLGEGAKRWQDIFATNATIQTSDGNLKQDVTDLSVTEKNVAVALKGLIKKFKLKSAVEKKGSEARYHVGVIAQDVEQVFSDNGLNASEYGLFCRNEWYEGSDGMNYPTNEPRTDDDGNSLAYSEKKERLSIRYEELLAFVISAI